MRTLIKQKCPPQPSAGRVRCVPLLGRGRGAPGTLALAPFPRGASQHRAGGVGGAPGLKQSWVRGGHGLGTALGAGGWESRLASASSHPSDPSVFAPSLYSVFKPGPVVPARFKYTFCNAAEAL